jgi:hypothetical protein
MDNKKKILIVGGVIGVGALIYFLSNKKSTSAIVTQPALIPEKRKLTPVEKMTIDGYNPDTQFGAEIKRYHETRGSFSQAAVKGSIDWHLDPANNSWVLAEYKTKPFWYEDDVVLYSSPKSVSGFYGFGNALLI